MRRKNSVSEVDELFNASFENIPRLRKGSINIQSTNHMSELSSENEDNDMNNIDIDNPVHRWNSNTDRNASVNHFDNEVDEDVGEDNLLGGRV